VVVPLTAHVVAGQSLKLTMDQWRQAPERSLITPSPREKQRRDFLLGRQRHG
jgi:hypothetical protein